MAHFLHSICSFCMRKGDKFLLAAFWAAGLSFGGVGFRYAGSTLVSQIPLAVVSQPSFFELLISPGLPFLFSAFAVYINAPWLMYGVCFLNAFSACYISCGVFSAFGTAGWLVRWLFLFSNLISGAVLYYYCHRHISGVRRFSAPRFAGYAGVLFLTAIVDQNCVMPLLRRVLS